MNEALLERLKSLAALARAVKEMHPTAMNIIFGSQVRQERVNAITALALILQMNLELRALFESLSVEGISLDDLLGKSDQELAQSGFSSTSDDAVRAIYEEILFGMEGDLQEVIEGFDLAFSIRLQQLILCRKRAKELLIPISVNQQ